MAPHLVRLRARERRQHLFEGRAAYVERIHVVLRKVADTKLPIPHDATVDRLQFVQHQLEQGGLAHTVGAKQTNAAGGVDAKADVVKQQRCARLVGEANAVNLQHGAPNVLWVREGEVPLRFGSRRRLQLRQFSQCLDARLHQAGSLGIEPELVDELLFESGNVSACGPLRCKALQHKPACVAAS